MREAHPLHDRLLVRRIEEKDTAKGGIIVPANAKQRPQKGEVLAVGNGRDAHGWTSVALDVKIGDKVLFGRRAGIDIELGGEDLLILPEDEFLVVLT